jgi:two-component sensor histidine kinase
MTTTTTLFEALAADRLLAAAEALDASAIAADNVTLRSDIAALAEAAAVLNGVLVASGDCIKVLDLDGRIIFVNDSGYKALEAVDPGSLQARLWTDFWPGEPAAAASIAEARAGRNSRFAGPAATFLGNNRHWDVRITPVRSAAADVTQILVISRDITEQHQLEAQKQLLAGELEHRINNMLAMVVAIGKQTMRPPASLEEASDSFVSRVQALARAQAILTRTSWDGADICLVVDGALKPHRSDGNSNQFHVSGPHLELSANRALALVLALHELATNAAKYGALSAVSGRVHLHWRTDQNAQLVIEWREEGGPLVTQPKRTGFGSKMIRAMLAAEFQGQVEIEYAPTGVTCVLIAPLD